MGSDYALLAAAQLVGLLLIPIGLPGIWLQVGALAWFGYSGDWATVGLVQLGAAALIALVAEAAEWVLAGRFARRYGGSSRAAWGAVLGGLVGALVGVPVPIVGSVIGAFVGTFVGAIVAELSARRGAGDSIRVGWGALLGRVAAVGTKVAAGVMVAAIALVAAS